MRAGVFDSGIGGLTVVKSLLEHNVFDEIIYYGDTARVPYGVKDKNTITRYSLEALEFFENFNIDILIIACNSVSAYSIKELKASSKVPVIGVIESGVLAIENSVLDRDSNILIIGTKATIDSNRYETLLREKNFNNLKSIATGLFVPIVEEEIFDGAILDEAIDYYFKETQKPDIIILGCTHFPLISEPIKKYWKNNIELIHSGEAIVEFILKHKAYKKSSSKRTKLEFFSSENPKNLRKIAKNWLSL